MKIADFTSSEHRYAFGTDSKAVAQVLRKMADSLDSGELILQSARLTSLAKNDDYAFTSIRLIFGERKEPVKALYGDSAFPVDVMRKA